jgi:hypothetical protein
MEKKDPERGRRDKRNELYQAILKALCLEGSSGMSRMSDEFMKWNEREGYHQEIVIEVNQSTLGAPKVRELIEEGNNIKIGDELYLEPVGDTYEIVRWCHNLRSCKE